MKKTLSISRNIILITLLVVGVSYVQAAFQQPLGTPQTTNVDAPVNTGSTLQVKTGNFGTGFLYSAGGAWIGTPGTGAGRTNVLALNPYSPSDPSHANQFFIELYDPSLTSGGDQRLIFSGGSANPYLMQLDFLRTNPSVTLFGNAKLGVGIVPTPSSEKLEVAGRVKSTDYCLDGSPERCLSRIAKDFFMFKRTTTAMEGDQVAWCTPEYPYVVSCDIVDDQAPAGDLYSLPTGGCPLTDGACNAWNQAVNGNSPAAVINQRIDLGPDFLYKERVRNGNVWGCHTYDSGHDHAAYKIDLICGRSVNSGVIVPP